MSGGSLERLVRVVAEAKRTDPLAPVTIIVPNNLAARTIGWRLAEGLGDGRRAVAGLRITTSARLAESLAAVRLHPRQPLLPSVLAAAWRSELEANAGAHHWEFAEVWDHPSTVSALVRAYRQLREVDGGDLPVDRLGPVTAETVRLAGLVRERLAPDWYDQQDLYATASPLVTGSPGVLAEYGRVVTYLLGDEPRSALAFLDALSAATPVADVSEQGEPRLAGRVLHASDSDDEVRTVVREVVAALSGGQRARRLAVLYTRPDPYVRTLHAHLAAAGVEFNGRGGIPVAEMAGARAFLDLLDLHGRQYPRAQLFHALSAWPVRQFDGEPVRTVGWERVSRDANIAGTEPVDAGWVLRLDDLIAQQREEAARATKDRHRHAAERRIGHAEQLRAFIVTLDERLRELDAAPTWEDVSERCLSLLAELFGDVDDIRRWELEQKRAFVTLRSILAELRSLDAYRRPTGIADLVDVLTAQLEAAVPRTGKFGRGVFVGPVAQARGLDLDQVWVVGLSEDMYPGRQTEDGMLPDWLRAETDGLISAREQVERLTRDLEAAFASAAHITASFPRGDLRASTEKLPSRLLLPSLRHLVGNPALSATAWHTAPAVDDVVDCPSFAGGIRTAGAPSSDQEWAMRRVLDVREGFEEPAFRAARDLQRHRSGREFTRFDGNLAGVGGLPRFADGERRISPTALESYGICPFAYFVKRLLYVEPVEEPSATEQVSPLTVGNVFHYAMDRFITAEKAAGTLPGPGVAWSDAQVGRLDAYADEVIAEFRQRGLLGHPTLWGFAEPGIRANLRRMLADDNEWRARLGAAPVASELRFGFDEEPASVEVDGGIVRFLGSADKVDIAGDTVYVTDIKSGSAEKFKKIAPGRGKPNPTVDGTKLQLPVYARAALQAYPEVSGAEAQYWFVHGRDVGRRIQLALTDDLERTFSHAVGTLVDGIARGHFFKKPSKDPGYLWVDCEYCTPGGAGHETARNGYLAKRAAPELLGLLDVIDPDGADELRARVADEEAEQ